MSRVCLGDKWGLESRCRNRELGRGVRELADLTELGGADVEKKSQESCKRKPASMRVG